MDGNDIQRLEQRIAALEAQLAGGGRPSGPGGQTPGEWISGLITQNLPSSGPLGGQAAGGAAGGAITGSSTCWCQSRFVCATMNCGGSGWC